MFRQVPVTVLVPLLISLSSTGCTMTPIGPAELETLDRTREIGEDKYFIGYAEGKDYEDTYEAALSNARDHAMSSVETEVLSRIEITVHSTNDEFTEDARSYYRSKTHGAIQKLDVKRDRRRSNGKEMIWVEISAPMTELTPARVLENMASQSPERAEIIYSTLIRTETAAPLTKHAGWLISRGMTHRSQSQFGSALSDANEALSLIDSARESSASLDRSDLARLEARANELKYNVSLDWDYVMSEFVKWGDESALKLERIAPKGRLVVGQNMVEFGMFTKVQRTFVWFWMDQTHLVVRGRNEDSSRSDWFEVLEPNAHEYTRQISEVPGQAIFVGISLRDPDALRKVLPPRDGDSDADIVSRESVEKTVEGKNKLSQFMDTIRELRQEPDQGSQVVVLPFEIK